MQRHYHYPAAVGSEVITLTAHQIKSLQAQTSALMPDQQRSDLFAYLMKRAELFDKSESIKTSMQP